jgi:hypothetical protein
MAQAEKVCEEGTEEYESDLSTVRHRGAASDDKEEEEVGGGGSRRGSPRVVHGVRLRVRRRLRRVGNR